MGTPSDHLPQSISEDAINALLRSIGLPEAITIVNPEVTAQYHSIYFITLPPNEISHGYSELVLRVSGCHLPKIKTRNEIGVMTWLAKNTTIPIPDVVAYDASEENPIAHEYTLLSKVCGVTLSDIYDSLDDVQMTWVLDQLIDFLSQLHAHPWEGIGGLDVNAEGGVLLAQVVDENFWQVPDAERLWPPGETVATLNIEGPFPTYVALISAQVKKYMRLIRAHEKLAFMRDTLPRLEAFVTELALPHRADELNKVALRLAHKDLHLANLVFDHDSGRITAVLDWEFSGVVPFTKWNPRRSFLWNGRDDDQSSEEKQRLLALFTQRCQDRGVTLLEDAKYASPLQESMQKAADFLRAIVEVLPRDQQQDLVQGWRNIVLESNGLD
ncbi:phosphotransferase enzyme family-domain-containing protein [Diaporthe sp. PMI_573]|nr:phosphotransferase enzyme family-domain-containing protein [Diaporthaceae sp. PMI_573]